MKYLPKKDTLNNKFYHRALIKLLEKQEILKTDNVLIICGGTTDFEVFKDLEFENVTISNLDERMLEHSDSPYAPYKWSFENGENMSFDDDSFDWVVVHAGLHHLKCPQKGIAEMYRLAKKGILCMEPYDGLYTKLGVKLGFGQEYETSAVFANDLKFGGLENTHIPNFVYRFNKKEFTKLISTMNPAYHPKCSFQYSMSVPRRLGRVKNPLVRGFFKYIGGTLEWLGSRLPVMANNIAMVAIKDENMDNLQPWLIEVEGQLKSDETYYNKKFVSSKSK